MVTFFFNILVAFSTSPAAFLAGTDTVPPKDFYPVDSVSINEAERLREQYRNMMEQKNKVGSKAANFSFITREGSKTSLYDLSTDGNILLLFYDPDCEDCHATIHQLSDLSSERNFSIVAIDSEDDRPRWEQTAMQLPEGWTVGFATDPVQEDEIYYLLSMPTMYLLDKNKKVLLKETSLEEVLKIR
ncbi:MAG: thioredoxin family protein [Muribaculaceae bacterium]|nr:thioredoxin family protein [Muribaculaceae bacterium]